MSDTRWIVVRNWDRFQHYHDRNVPWIKFYTELLHDPDLLSLTPGRRWILCSLWLAYAQSRCRLPADTRQLSRRLDARVRQDDLDALNHAGFILFESRPCLEHVQMDSRPTRAREETETELETEQEPPLPPLAPAARPPDELWDALTQALGQEPTTTTERGRRNKALKELRAIGATPTDIATHAARFRTTWPNLTLTETGLVAHWSRFHNGPKPNGHICTLCPGGLELQSKARLTEHLHVVHEVDA